MAVKKSVNIYLSAETQAVVSALNSVGKDLMQFGTNAQRIGQQLGTVFDPLMKTVVGISGALVAAAGAFAGASLTIGGGFEQQMALVRNVANATAEEFEQLNLKARQMGRDLPITADQAAAAMYELASAGMSVQEILASIDSVVAVAIGQNYGLAESAEVVVATLRSFGLEASESGRVVDVFANAANISQLTMKKLADSITYVAPLAKALGISLEESVAAMAVLSDTGMEGSQIGTSLRRVLSSLADSAGPAGKRIRELGIQVKDAAGRMKPLEEIMRSLASAGMTAEQALSIFGDRGAVAALQLAAMVEQIDKYKEKLKEVGVAQKQLNDLLNTWDNIRKSVTSATQNLFITSFEQLKGKAKEIAEAIRDLINVFDEWAASTEIIKQTVEAFFSGLFGGLPTLESFKSTLSSIDVDMVVKRFKDLGEGIRALLDSFRNLAEKIPWKLLAENLDTITEIIVTGWVAGEISLIAGGIVGLAKAFKLLADAVKAVAIAEKGSGLVVAVKGAVVAFGMLATAVATALSFIMAYPDEIGESVEELDRLKAALEGNREAFESLSAQEKAWLKEHWDIDERLEKAETAAKATEKLQDLSKSMRDTMTHIFTFYKDEASAASAAMRMYGEGIKEYLSLAGIEGADALKAAFKGMGPEVNNVVENVLSQILEDITKVLVGLAALPQEMPGMVQIIVDTYEDQGKAASRIMRQYGDDIKRFLSESGVEGANKLKESFANLGEEVGKVMEDVVAKVQAAMIAATQPPEEPTTYSGSIKDSMKQAVIDFTVYAADLISKTKELSDEFGLSGEEAGKAMEEKLSAKIKNIADNLVNQFDNPALRSVFRDTFVQLAEQSGGGFYRNLKQYLDKSLGLLKEFKPINEQIADAVKDMENAFGGEWKGEVKLGKSDFKTGEFEHIIELTDGIRYQWRDLVEYTESKPVAFESLVRSLQDIKAKMSEAFSAENINMPKLTEDVSVALQSLASPAKVTGQQIGNSLYEGIMQGVNRAATDAKNALSAIKIPGGWGSLGSVTDAMRSDL